ncbi:MAG: PAS domain S-box protein [Methanoregulaceae archaeon]
MVCNDIERDPMMAPWRKGALERGYRSLAVFPFAPDTGNSGVITFCASEPGFFNDRIIRLLDEQAGDISFALMTLDHEEQRIAAEHELKKSELKYRRLFQTAQDAILILDGDTGKIIDANTFILDMLGYPLDYFVGRHLWELGFHKDKFFARDAFAKLKSDRYIRYEDLPLETKQGEAINVEFVSNVYLVEDKKIIQCNIRDITARKRGEEALMLANRKLNLLSGITRHDIRNQLVALSGYLEISKKTLDDPVRTSEFIANEQKIAEIIARQIDFTKDYEDLGVKAPAWQNITRIVQEIIPRLPMQNIRVDTGEPDREVFADPLLEKVFYNLIDNALRYGGERMKSIRMTSRENDGKLVITVEDDSNGIRAEEKKRLFMKGSGRNTGLGLCISREILSITGITISESGVPGAGAKFEIAVPEGAFRFTKKPELS